ncbi:MAG: amino acid ABC transporter permease [Deltaproteobacteria bacterium]|nr:amino acid ABC transporter permease [Deltaproteobacteria bacterium]
MAKEQLNPSGAAPMEKPPKITHGVLGWMRINLFSDWYNTILTILALYLVFLIIRAVVDWGLISATFGMSPDSCRQGEGACWGVVGHFWGLFMVGTYPYELRWRIGLVLFIIVAMGLASRHSALRSNRWYWAAWVALVVPVFLLIRGSSILGLEVVDSTLWGGLLLTMMLSVVGIIVSFPISIVLALGRRSEMPIIKALSVGYIELFRGVPLITILFMASVMLPLFFPPGFSVDKVLRAQIGIIMFYSAYLAEVVRGGLQAIPKGQEEAAKALGLGYWQTMILIVMPQALRVVIPPLVGTFIQLLKDTSLVSIVSLIDLLGVAHVTTQNPDWLGRVVEAYVFVGFLYWVICFSMSRYSVSLEKRFKAGQY